MRRQARVLTARSAQKRAPGLTRFSPNQGKTDNLAAPEADQPGSGQTSAVRQSPHPEGRRNRRVWPRPAILGVQGSRVFVFVIPSFSLLFFMLFSYFYFCFHCPATPRTRSEILKVTPVRDFGKNPCRSFPGCLGQFPGSSGQCSRFEGSDPDLPKARLPADS
jgi:hypothetical protein